MPRLLLSVEQSACHYEGDLSYMQNDKHYRGLTVQRRPPEREKSGWRAGRYRPSCCIPGAPVGLGSEPYPSETQRVRDHGHGAEAHRGTRNDRAQEQAEERIEHAASNGYAKGVVDEGEE